MMRILDRLGFRLSIKKTETLQEEDLGQILQKTYSVERSADPETRAQWARLQSSLVQTHTTPLLSKSRLVPRLAFGISLLVLAAVGISLYYSSSQPVPEIFATGRGEQKQITLADGSEVRIHHTTELTVVSLQAGKPRRVLLNGEAFFRVRKNDTPFIITTNQASVEVLGTEFNVRSRKEALEVAVIGGKVKVQTSAAGTDNAIVLTKDQMAITRMNEAPQFAGTIPSHEYPGWMSGKLFLNKTPFADACQEIELRFDVKIVLSNTRASSMTITGTLDAATPASAVTSLCALTGTQYTRKGDTFEVF